MAHLEMILFCSINSGAFNFIPYLVINMQMCFFTLQLNSCAFFTNLCHMKDKTVRYHTMYHKIRINSSKVRILSEKKPIFCHFQTFWIKNAYFELTFHPDDIKTFKDAKM